MEKDRRPLGPWTSTAMVVGTTIGSGIFLLPAALAPFGRWTGAGWLLTSLGALLAAAALGMLARRNPLPGGPYAYAGDAFGEFAAFWVAWGHWVSLWTSVAGIAVAMIGHAGLFLPWLDRNPAAGWAAATGTVWLLSWTNMKGLTVAGRLQLGLTAAKLVPLVAISVWGLFAAPVAPPAGPSTLSLSSLAAMAALMFWAFIGLESAAVPAQATADPGPTIARATIGGIVLVALIYLLSTRAVVNAIPAERLARSHAPFAELAGLYWGDWAYWATALAAILSCLGAMNGTILVQGQLAAAAADDGLFPSAMAGRGRSGAPRFALLLPAFLVTLLLGFKYSSGAGLIAIFEFTILLATLSTLVPYAFCAAALLALARRDSHSRAPQAAYAIGLAAFALLLLAIAGSGAATVLYGFLLLMIGLPLFALRPPRALPA